MKGLAEHYGFSLDTPIEELPPEIVDVLLYGTKGGEDQAAPSKRVRQRQLS